MPKAPPLFAVEGLLVAGSTVALDDRARRHARARRLAAGDGVRLSDGTGAGADGTIERISRDALEVRIGRVAPAAPRSGVELCVSAIRLPRLSWLVEKATELGADAVTIVASGRAQRGRVEGAAAGLGRLERIAREAAQQSGQSALPRLAGPIPSDEVARRAESVAHALVLDRSGEPFPTRMSAPAAIWIGPEGGWSEEELSSADAAGWTRVRLPGATLRTETAAIAALVLALRAIDTAPRADGQ
jgi:16S rRNA (uracil1498-N3)-methyltransferase